MADDRGIRHQQEQIVVLLNPNTPQEKAYAVVWEHRLQANIDHCRLLHPGVTIGTMPVATRVVTVLDNEQDNQ